MRLLAAIAACLTITFILRDVFNTIVLARRTRHSFQLTRIVYLVTWRPFAGIVRHIQSGERREEFLGVYGPLSFLLIVALWASGLAVAFGFLQWAIGLEPASLRPRLSNDLYLSATALLTLETGDPKNALSKWLAIVEGGLGFSLLGLVVGYLPTFYQAFAERELQISLLDARSGSPPSVGSLLQMEVSNAGRIERYLEVWERWAAEILENQLSFPTMAWFRSHHANQSWLSALTAMVDYSAVVRLCAEGDLKTQAEFTFAMGNHALVDIATILKLQPASQAGERLSHADFSALRQAIEKVAAPLKPHLLREDRLADLRRMYEPHAQALSDYLLIALPQWVAQADSLENWKVPRKDRRGVPFAVSDPFRQD